MLKFLESLALRERDTDSSGIPDLERSPGSIPGIRQTEVISAPDAVIDRSFLDAYLNLLAGA